MRKICFIITSHVHYGRSRMLLKALRAHKDVTLQVALGASAILPQYGDVREAMKADGIVPEATITMTLAGGTPVAMAKTTGIGIMEFATVFENLKPDVVVVRGDRYEVLAAAVAAAYMNIPVAHIEGGDVTGSIDESVRHAVTKLAHIHFATNEAARERIIRMGENPEYIFNFGSPELEGLDQARPAVTSDDVNTLGVGAPLDLGKPFSIVLYHPVTTEAAKNREHTTTLLRAVNSSGSQCLWFWPNVDAGTDDVAKAIRVFREHEKIPYIHFATYVPSELFISLLQKCACIIGNSSAGIKEASYLGVPCVNVGTRQSDRLRGPNVIDASENISSLTDAIAKQMKHGRYPRSDIYWKPDCSKNMTNTLSTLPLYVQKRFHD